VSLNSEVDCWIDQVVLVCQNCGLFPILFVPLIFSKGTKAWSVFLDFLQYYFYILCDKVNESTIFYFLSNVNCDCTVHVFRVD